MASARSPSRYKKGNLQSRIHEALPLTGDVLAVLYAFVARLVVAKP